MELFEIKEEVEKAYGCLPENPDRAMRILDLLFVDLVDDLIAEGTCPECGGEIRLKVTHYTDQDGKPEPDEYTLVCNFCGYELE